jgi:aspartyl-tRNA synthetase
VTARPPRANRYRTAWAGDLRAADVDREVRVAGWVHRRRDHGGLIFVDLRDRTGLLQIVFHPETAPEAHRAAHGLRAEDVITVAGTIARREEGAVNPNLATGEVELKVAELEQLADAETPPFQVDDEGEVAEETRMRYRYIDLRRQRTREAIELRHRVAAAIRDHLRGEGFLEVETPMLTRSTPEGARDYLVPSRVNRGSWYALPQSPQLFKQLFMVAGLERYFQIVRCFRDEDPRADRQPEFTQLDMELSFVEEEDVMAVVDELLRSALAVAGVEVQLPIDRLTYDEALLRYGTDRPDRRPGMEIRDLAAAFAGSEFKVFAGALEAGGVVRGFAAPGATGFSRKDFDDLVEFARRWGGRGVAWLQLGSGGEVRSPIAKFLSEAETAAILEATGAGEGDTVFLVADQEEVAVRVLGPLRLHLAGRLGLVGEGWSFVWVTDFPMFEWLPDEGRWKAAHHPFTSPTADSEASFDQDPSSARARAYDLVLNGNEIGGGSIRIHRQEVQRRVFELLGISAEEAEEKFSFLLRALSMGAPPHGGIAFGLDRLAMLLAEAESLREVTAFPKGQGGVDPLTGAPSRAPAATLAELGLRVAPAKAPVRHGAGVSERA